eukprot:CAMPEP_0194067942 /NCGR_PEP_ID=MMETSP0009_2-20130614/86824_1 /TAXON_ID=210454 /ORGANISM="Grammatophora oceanica, Strain CCMP 410" /LENGTH=218 /DNA_ID=CAMNT_0038720995 /DNA_START=974 /DNA_END=1627 /DNA_ORIENTATION=-
MVKDCDRADQIRDQLMDRYNVFVDDGVTCSISFEQRDFETADNLRDALQTEYNVAVNDREMVWAVGNLPDDLDVMDTSAKRAAPANYRRKGNSELSPQVKAQIISLIEERNDCKFKQKFGKADRIRDQLMDEFGVRVDDGSKAWHLIQDEYTMTSDSASLDSDTKSVIQNMLAERSRFKMVKDYYRADQIRDQLMDRYNVFVDDGVTCSISFEQSLWV